MQTTEKKRVIPIHKTQLLMLCTLLGMLCIQLTPFARTKMNEIRVLGGCCATRITRHPDDTRGTAWRGGFFMHTKLYRFFSVWLCWSGLKKKKSLCVCVVNPLTKASARNVGFFHQHRRRCRRCRRRQCFPLMTTNRRSGLWQNE